MSNLSAPPRRRKPGGDDFVWFWCPGCRRDFCEIAQGLRMPPWKKPCATCEKVARNPYTRPAREGMVDITGQRFGRLTAAWPAGKRKERVLWLCFCECGDPTFASVTNLRRGNTRSCGCLRRHETARRGHRIEVDHVIARGSNRG